MRTLLVSTSGRRASLLVFAMLVAATVNLIQFGNIDTRLPAHYKALHEYDTFRVETLGQRQSNIRRTTNLFSAIGERAPGATLIATTPELAGARWFQRGMLSLGRVRAIETCPMSPSTVRSLDAPQKLVATGKIWPDIGWFRNKRPGWTWALGEMSPEPKRLVQLKTSETDILILDSAHYNIDFSKCDDY